MRTGRLNLAALALTLLAAGSVALGARCLSATQARCSVSTLFGQAPRLDVPYAATRPELVMRMLDMAGVEAGDLHRIGAAVEPVGERRNEPPRVERAAERHQLAPRPHDVQRGERVVAGHGATVGRPSPRRPAQRRRSQRRPRFFDRTAAAMSAKTRARVA